MNKLQLVFLAVGLFILSAAYPQTTSETSKKNNALFSSDKILNITLRGNLRDLMNDRGENPITHSIQVVIKDEANTEKQLSAEAKTRGHFRKLKENCGYPPLLLRFTKSDSLNNSVFKGNDKCKLVMPCVGDNYVVYEWLVYKLYNLITPKSFEARLVKVGLEDTRSKKNTPPFYGILLEEEKKMAKRNKMLSIERKLRPEQALQQDFLTMAMFEYLIGNTDWSVQYLQNIKLIAADSLGVASTVAYDFDHSGLVDAPYAHPAEELMMHSVRERRYRGYCITNMKLFDASIALFNKVKPEILSLYNNCPYIDEKYKKTTIKYIEEFYTTINNPSAFQKEFGYPCDKNGTGNVVIKGYKTDE